MRSQFIRIVFLFSSFALISSCASKPQLYPNEKYNAGGKEVAEADIKDCETRADAHLGSTKGRQIAESAGTGLLAGAALGAVTGALTGGAGMGALAGGAAGTVAGGAYGAASPNTTKRGFVDKCLKDKGYDVIGWQ